MEFGMYGIAHHCLECEEDSIVLTIGPKLICPYCLVECDWPTDEEVNDN
jgi:hypothetical protein